MATLKDELTKLKKQLAANLEKALMHVEEKVKRKISQGQPYRLRHSPSGEYYVGLAPSAPGQPPKLLRGDLRRSYAYELDRAALVGRVGTNLFYAKTLEFGNRAGTLAARPHLRATVDEERATVAAILATRPN